jgi:hypothetical protein
MIYLITTKDSPPFLTNWFDAENNFNADLEMVVYDLENCIWTDNGLIWQDIEIDHL